MKPKPIKEIISDYLQKTDFKTKNKIILIEKEWDKTVGKLISKNTEITRFDNGKLTVKTSNPVWRNELTLQKSELLKKLNQTIKEILIKEIIFR